jgi:hypothetical protein
MTSFKHSGSEGDIEIIRQVYSGINRNDIDFVLNLMDVDSQKILRPKTCSPYAPVGRIGEYRKQ